MSAETLRKWPRQAEVDQGRIEQRTTSYRFGAHEHFDESDLYHDDGSNYSQ